MRYYVLHRPLLTVKTMDNSLIPDAQAAYVSALAFPANESQPLLWWEVANLYVGFGSYDGPVCTRACTPHLPTTKVKQGHWKTEKQWLWRARANVCCEQAHLRGNGSEPLCEERRGKRKGDG